MGGGAGHLALRFASRALLRGAEPRVAMACLWQSVHAQVRLHNKMMKKPPRSFAAAAQVH